MRIVLVTYSLLAGGAERVLAAMANHWAAGGREIHLVTLDASVPFYKLHPGVRLHQLGVAKQHRLIVARAANDCRRVISLRTCLRQIRPDVVISFQTTVNLMTLAAAVGLRVPVVVSERNNPIRPGNTWLHRWLSNHAYRIATAVVVQTERLRQTMCKGLLDRIVVIENPLRIEQPLDRAPQALPPYTILGLGRYVRDKGFDILIDAFAKMSQIDDWSLTLVGDGPEKANLMLQAEQLGLGRAVHFLPVQANPIPLFAAAEIVAAPSRVEGFPNTLCEAMAAGRAVVAADCPYGPREIVRHGIDGLLVPPDSPDALAEALASLTQDEPLRKQLGARAKEIASRLATERIMAQWEDLLASCTTEMGPSSRRSQQPQRSAA